MEINHYDPCTRQLRHIAHNVKRTLPRLQFILQNIVGLTSYTTDSENRLINYLIVPAHRFPDGSHGWKEKQIVI